MIYIIQINLFNIDQTYISSFRLDLTGYKFIDKNIKKNYMFKKYLQYKKVILYEPQRKMKGIDLHF